MRLSGERCRDGGIGIVPQNSHEYIESISPVASQKIAIELMENVCAECPALDIQCGGAGAIRGKGFRVIQKGNLAPVVHPGCQIAGSKIEVSIGVIWTARIPSNRA